MKDKYGDDTSIHPEVDPDIWLQSAGESKKGRVRGLGHSLDLDTQGSSHASFSEVTGPSARSTPLTSHDVTVAINAALASFMETQMSQMQTQLMQAQMQFLRTEILPALQTQTQAPAPAPAPPSAEQPREDDDDDVTAPLS